jgi:predicted transposase YbfD/YdcC
MDDAVSRDLLRPFDTLPDPRAPNVVHPMGHILLIAIMAVTCGAPDWASVARWGRAKREWLATFMNLPASGGIPSRDTFRRFFAALDPEAFERCFMLWVAQLARITQGRLVAIDGKTLRRSFHRASGQEALHRVSAGCEKNHVVLGQLAVDDKSNEIKAIPKLLELLDLVGATVSIDAMGCQKHIAARILERQGDYLLAVKDNHPNLHQDIAFFFEDAIQQADPRLVRLDQPTVEADHGRLETRMLWASHEVDWLKVQGHHWPSLRGIVCVEGRRQTLGPEGKTSVERRYLLTSLDPRTIGAPALLAMARGHWGVENKLHWCLDVSFSEDQRRLRDRNGAENFSRLCRLSLNLLKAEKTIKLGIANKRLNCGWDNDYLLKVLLNLG